MRLLLAQYHMDVHVWAILCDGTTDRILEGNIHEKTDASELVLDGHLLGENPSEINLAELLQLVEKEFASMVADLHAEALPAPGAEAGGFVDESILEKDWPALRSQLAFAARRWHRPENIIDLPTLVPTVPLVPCPVTHHAPRTMFDDLPLWRQAMRPSTARILAAARSRIS